MLPSYRGICSDVQTSKIIFISMYMTGAALQTWGREEKGWGEGWRGGCLLVSWQVTRSSLSGRRVSYGAVCVG